SNMSESLQCFSTPTVSGSTRTVTTPAAAYYDIDWRHPDAYNPSANYYVANVNLQWTQAGSNIGARSFGLTSDQNSQDKKFYFLTQLQYNGDQGNFQGHFAGLNTGRTEWNAAPSSNFSGESYHLDFMSTSDDAGNLLFFGIKHGTATDDKELLQTGCGQGSTRAMIIPNSSAGIKQTSVTAAQSRTFDIGSTKIADRGQFVYGTGDFSSAGGGNFWILPYGGSTIYKGGFRNVSTSGGERIAAKLIPTGLSNSVLGTGSTSYLNSVTPYTDIDGNQRALVCLFNEGIYDGPIENDRFLPTLVSSNTRHAQGKPSMFMIQDRKLLVCPTGTSPSMTMGLFEVSNDAAGVMTMTQVGSNFTPISGSASSWTKGAITRVVPIDDLTADIYCASSPLGLAVYRVRLEPEPVVTVSTEIINNYTSQAKKLTWTTKANTSPVGFLIEVSTDGGSTWTTISSPQPRAGSDSPGDEGDPNNTGSMREFTDTDASRATADCQYRVSAIYDSFTSIARHTAIPKNQTVSKVAPSKGVTFESSQCLFKQLKTGTGMYNGSATSSAYDLYGLTGSFTWIHPQKIDNTTLFNDKVNNVEESAGHDYGFELVGYYVTIKEKNANVYLKTSDNRTLNNLYLAMSEIGSPGSNGTYHYVENVPGLKRGVQYTYTVTPVYKYQGAGSEYLGAAMSYDTPAWDYSPEPVKNLTVDTYFQADAPREEWWGDRATGHAQTVYYDIYRVEITMDDPNYVNSPGGWSSSASSSYKVYPSFHKVEVNKGNGVWVPLTDMPYEYLSGADGAVISTYPNQAGVNCSYNRTFTKDGFGYFMGGNFGSNYNYSYGTYSFNNHRKKPDEGFSKDVNIGFYYFICNGVNKAHSLGHIATPRATGEKTPDQWEYRVTSYYGSSSTVQSSGTNYTPDPSFADSAVATASSGAPVITGVEAPTFQADGLRVYPNPTQGELNLASNEPIQSIRIVSIAGALMRSIDGNYQNTQTIDISSLVAGNYFVIVNSQKPVHVIKR
ncbi:MAG: T9SS type A sorting domain-containing protein, partial [Muribaculaceae bacterium]|nr:T9SS type A sorting domain-containing protein [Muribaculaceae bacterium]